MKLSYRNQLILTGALIAVLATLVIALLIMPRLSEARDIDDRIQEAEIQIEQAEALLAQRQAVKARSPETEAQRMRLANQIPEHPELPSLVVELQDTVNAAGLEFASLTPDPPEQTEMGPWQVSINMTVRGTWADTVDLLQRLPELTRQIRVVGYNTAAHAEAGAGEEDEDDDTETKVETAMTIRVYYGLTPVAPDVPEAPPETETQQ